MKKLEYTIEYARGILQIEERVRYRLDDGWIPQGGVCLVENASGSTYVQAMVKYGDEDD
jgi:hypothetical protein